MDDNAIATRRDDVRDYYGQVLDSKNDLKTSACCPVESMPVWARPLVGNIESEILDRFYGCGSPLPLAVEGRTVLDLGCGTGRDCYILSQMVGPRGQVIGVDMTEAQLEVARRHMDAQMRRFGYGSSNVAFHHSIIEDLGAAGIADSSVDVVVSNCVINLSPDKERVFREIFRVLKPGGELIFSDVFAGRRVPASIRADKVLVGECLGGAMYIEDFRRMLWHLGCFDYRVVSRASITLDDPDVQRMVGMIDFHSVTVRTFKLDFEDICENFGHVARYRGTITAAPHGFDLDDHHHFATGLPVPVCGNTARMLAETRLGQHFDVQGDFSTHYGPFDCGPLGAPGGAGGPVEGACC